MSQDKTKSNNFKNIAIGIFYCVMIVILLGSGKYLEKLSTDIVTATEEISEIATCEVSVGDIHYKGICDSEIKNAVLAEINKEDKDIQVRQFDEDTVMVKKEQIEWLVEEYNNGDEEAELPDAFKESGMQVLI